ncbi:MAG TPA: ATP-binding cassette domain-containing protein [Candidatus Acidoferrum sp.]|nr:ATP-binding cassette domain-containing protein [Candidatus Acidoferrum sp.]
MIRLDHVTKRYPGGHVAVRELSIEFPTGQLTMLVGPSGCGKTTTLKMINRLIEPTSGRIFHDDQDVTHIDPIALRLRMGYVIQNVGLFPHLTIAENIATVPRLLRWDKMRTRKRVEELLELVGLDPHQFGRRYPHQLSGGQRQRVGVARALGADPPVLLMDEPFGAIDRIARERLQNEFLRIQREVRKTVIFVTHDIDEAIKLGDRIAVMNVGQLVQYDTPPAILARPASDLVIDLLGPDRGLKRLAVTPIDVSVLEHPPIVQADDSLAEARQRLDRSRRAIVVDGSGKPIGELDREQASGDGQVRDRARPFDATVSADRTLYDAFSQMLIHHAGWVAVVDDSHILGVLTPEAFVAEIQRVPAEVEGVAAGR